MMPTEGITWGIRKRLTAVALAEAATLPFCVPDRIGVVAEVTMVFPANPASGVFFSPNLDVVAAAGDQRLLAAWRELGVATFDTNATDDSPDEGTSAERT